jgi:predicted alpha/beta-fold hydrolase
MALSGHLWTIAPSLVHRVRPARAPASVPWSTTLEDPTMGSITLRGVLRERADSDACLLVVHGLGGSPDAFYCVRAAQAAEDAGVSCLRLSLRGADRSGEDFYHAGLVADLEAAVASDALARYKRLYLLGYSLGGHVTLRYALSPSDPRVRAVATVCAPLDLELGARAIDRRRAFLYRRHVLAGLNEIYAAVAERRPVPTPAAEARAADSIRHWDSLTVVPRYGFGTAERYYTEMSVGPHLRELAVPALYLASEADPMVPPWTYSLHLEHAPSRLHVERVASGGHVGFPTGVRVAGGSAATIEKHAVRWLLQR